MEIRIQAAFTGSVDNATNSYYATRMPSPVNTLVLEALGRIDEVVAELQKAAHLSCLAGCGVCCVSPNVEASVLELLPLAEALWERGEAETWIERARTTAGTGVCVFYTGDDLGHDGGRCRIYSLRPSVCRLFGFSAVRDKRGSPVFAACRVLKEEMPRAVRAAEELMASGFPVLVIAEAALEIAGIDPHLGARKIPINAALALALDRVGFTRDLERRSPVSIDPGGEEPL